jgi:molybdate transport system regulatory protein
VPTITLRIKFGSRGHIGHGKVELLERIAASGSISAAAREMAMSYKRAWDLVEEMNRIFGKPMLETQKGGPGGGGARLTPAGETVVKSGRRRTISCPKDEDAFRGSSSGQSLFRGHCT